MLGSLRFGALLLFPAQHEEISWHDHSFQHGRIDDPSEPGARSCLPLRRPHRPRDRGVLRQRRERRPRRLLPRRARCRRSGLRRAGGRGRGAGHARTPGARAAAGGARGRKYDRRDLHAAEHTLVYPAQGWGGPDRAGDARGSRCDGASRAGFRAELVRFGYDEAFASA